MKVIIGVLQLFIGLGAVAGGSMLINDPKGISLNLSVEWLEGSPFSDFLIPGFILLIFVGLGNTIGGVLTFIRFQYSPLITILLGGFLMLWILVQLAITGYTSFLQPFYFALGVIELWLGFTYKKKFTLN